MDQFSREYTHSYKLSIVVPASVEGVFAYADDHINFSSHMNKRSAAMAGGSMTTEFDEGHGQQVGSHIKMGGKILFTKLNVDEVVTERTPPTHKQWETQAVNLLVIDHYIMGFDIQPVESNKSEVTVYIKYNKPQSRRTKWLGLLSEPYATYCVLQMVKGVKDHFKKVSNA